MAHTPSPFSTSPTNFDSRNHVKVGLESVSHVSSTDFPGHYPNEEHHWDLDKFKKGLTLKIQRLSNRSIDLDLVGVDASIANAFRRILIAEVPTICIEHVYMFNNTSVIVDEVLAQRIGMVPLNVNPKIMQMRRDVSDGPTDRDTIVFRLSETCTRLNPPPTPLNPAKPLPSELYDNHEILASQLVWVPQGEQASVFTPKSEEPSVMKGKEGIVLVKLRPGQEVLLECHAVKGLGKDHAKFSPVATASYRLLPIIILNPSNPVPAHLAEKFASCFAPGVISVSSLDSSVSVNDAKLRNDPVTREVLRHPEFENCVTLARRRDFFLFNIESESYYSPESLLPAAISVMREKLAVIKQSVEALLYEHAVADMGSQPEDINMTSLS